MHDITGAFHTGAHWDSSYCVEVDLPTVETLGAKAVPTNPIHGINGTFALLFHAALRTDWSSAEVLAIRVKECGVDSATVSLYRGAEHESHLLKI